jgi:iron(III) transport system substrate-binding protein
MLRGQVGTATLGSGRRVAWLGCGAVGVLLGMAIGTLPSVVWAASNYETAKKEGALTLYIDQNIETVQALVSAFKARYPGITVDFYRGDTSQVIQRFETESAAGRHTADVVTATERRGKVLVPKKLLAMYKSAELSRYPAGLQPDHGFWSVYSITTTAFAWNTQAVKKGDEPRDWPDLLDPKWKGKIGMQDPLQGGGAASWVATMYAVWGEPRWTEYMTKLGAQQVRYGRYLQVQDMLAASEIAVMVAAYPDYLEQTLKAKGAPVEWGTPNPVVRTGMSIQLSANAPHPNAGKLFIDFMLSDEAQALLAKSGKLPALQSQWPESFGRFRSTAFVPPADDLEREKFDFFQAKMKEFFGKR